MSKTVILDTGPLVAFLNRKDMQHQWAVNQFRNLNVHPLTCESVLSEAGFLLSRTSTGSDSVWQLVQRQFLRVPFKLEEHYTEICRLLHTYRDVPMSLADACIVRMSEIYPKAMVLTMDSDFQIYRKNKSELIPCFAPWES